MRSDRPILVDTGSAYQSAGLVHRVWQPSNDGPHPTIVMNHGRSGSEDVTWIFARTLPKQWLVVAPRALFEDPQGGYSWYQRPEGKWPTFAEFEDGAIALDRFIKSLTELYNADLSRLYLLGFSQGCALSYAYAMRNQEVVKGLAGMVGFLPMESEDSAEFHHLQDLPIFAAAGRRDETVPLTQSHRTAKLLVEVGARLDYREYNTGHKMTVQGLKDLANWWKQFE